MDVRSTEYALADAKARFSELVVRAEKGEEITIKRHGKAVAMLSPIRVSTAQTPEERVRAMEAWFAYREARRIVLGDDMSVGDLIESGRRD